ncbi:heparan-alpha-glucosaminide N-acetyltransferase domain-containing protein [Kytococcus sedentarius]|uniref:heparan-alpha-glucosaminide N-acetyltransferase domain-containing protein n=1 Tax=Kytococcus sedentarius TaxID=1276 RepID=UPI0035BC5D54
MSSATTAPVGPPAPSAPSGRTGRLTALDWARGIAVLANLTVIAVLPPVPDQLRHAPWEGVRVMDLVFPSFVVLAGAGLAFAYAHRSRPLVVLRRSLVLWACGLLYNGVLLDWPPLEEFRLMGPLQLYAVLVPVVALLSTRLRTPRHWGVALTVALAGTITLHRVWAARCGGLTPECNPSRSIDLPWMGQHAYHAGAAGHDPEGLVALSGALVTAGVGLVAGAWLRDLRGEPGAARRITQRVLVLVGLCVAGSVLLQLLGLPAVKRIWTPSFALLTAVPGVLVLLAAYLVFDARSRASEGVLVRVPVALGRNALLGYFGSHVALHWARSGERSLADRIVDLGGGGDPGRWLYGVVFVGVWVALAVLLARWRIYVRP